MKIEHNPKRKSEVQKNKCWARCSKSGDIFRSKSRWYSVNALLVWFSPIYLYLISPSDTVWLSSAPGWHVLRVLTVSLLREHVFRGNCGTMVLLSFEAQLPNVFYTLYCTIQHHEVLPQHKPKSNGQPTVHEISKSINQNNTSLFTVGGCYSDFSQWWNKRLPKAT